MCLIQRLPCFLILILFSGCNRTSEIVHSELVFPGKDKKSAGDTIIYDSITHLSFSRLSKMQSAGLQYYHEIPEALQNKHFYIVFSGRIRTNYAQSNASIIVAARDKNKNQICWKVCPLRSLFVYQNDWNHFNDSIHLPNVFENVKYVDLNAFPYLGNSRSENFDIDSFKVTLKKLGGF